MLKGFTRYLAVAVTALVLPNAALAVCSSYHGLATVNEIQARGNSSYFVEVKILDASIEPTVYDDWTVELCHAERFGPFTFDLCSGTWPLSDGDDTGFPWIVLDENTPGVDRDAFDLDGMDVRLRDAAGDTIDYVSVNNYDDNEDAQCDGAFDSDAPQDNGSGVLRRFPDGTGDWESGQNPNDDTPNDDNSGDPSLPSLTVSDDTVFAGETTNFDIRLSGSASSDVTFQYETLDGSANAPGDYAARSGTLTIPSGSTVAQISVPTSSTSGGGSFFVRISEVSNASVTDAIGRGTIMPAANAEYRMDSRSWAGNPDEVVDVAGNGYDGTARNGAQTSDVSSAVPGDPGTCGYGVFDGVDDFVEVNNLSTLLDGSASLAFWIRTTQTGNDTAWQAPGITGVEQSGGTNDIFWGWIDGSGHIGVSVGDEFDPVSASPINDGNWHHVVLTRDAGNGELTVFVDGSESASSVGDTGTISTAFSSIGRIEDTGGTPEYFQGELDEVRIYGAPLTEPQVRAVRDATHPCPSFLVCESRDFNSGSLGGDWQVSNESGAFGDPRVINGALRLTDQSSNVATRATLLDSIPWDNNRVEVTLRHYAYGTGSGDADGIAVTFSDASVAPDPGGYGGSLGYAQRNGGIDGFAGGWLGIALDEYGNFSNPSEGRIGGPGRTENSVAVRGDGSGQTGYEYIAGTATLNPTVSAPGSDTRAPGHLYRFVVDTRTTGQALLEVQRDTTGTGSSFVTLISEDVADDQNSLPPAEVFLTFTGATGGSANFHEIDDLQVCASRGFGESITAIQIEHDGAAVTCQAEPITIRIVDASGNRVRDFTGTVNLATSTNNGAWSVIDPSTDAFGSLSENPGDDDGQASYTFADADNGEIVLGLRNTHVEDVDVDVVLQSDGAISDDDSEGLLTFAETGFQFLVNGAPGNIGAQIGGKPSDVAPGEQTLELQALRTNDQTGACEAAFQGATDVDFRFECLDPGTCAGGGLTLNGIGIASVAGAASSQSESISLDFGDATDTTAPVAFRYDDVGRIRLVPEKTLQPNGQTMVGPSNGFVVRPFGFAVSAAGNPGAGGPTGPVYTAAGQPFNVDVAAVLWASADDTDGNGIPDGHDNSTVDSGDANLSDNATAANFGQESGGGASVTLSGELRQPSGGNDPGLAAGSSVSGFSGGAATVSARFDEVGILELKAAIAGGQYLGINAAGAVGASGYVGRFTPAQFTTDIDDPTGAFAAACTAGSMDFTYTGQGFGYMVSPVFRAVARAADGAGAPITSNYRGAFNKLAAVGFSTSIAGTGTDAGSGLEWTRTAGSVNATDNGDGTTDMTLDGDTFTYAKVQTANTEIAPFGPDIRIGLTAYSDSDGVGATDLPDPIPVDGTGTQIRYGRFAVANAYGSEMLPLEMPLAAEYFDGNGFVVNTADSCTTYDASGVTFENYSGDLSSGEVAAYGTGTLVGGRGDPANPLVIGGTGGSNTGPGESGAVDVVLGVPAYLRYDWDASAGGSEDPRGRANFGIYRGSENVIFQREVY